MGESQTRHITFDSTQSKNHSTAKKQILIASKTLNYISKTPHKNFILNDLQMVRKLHI